MFAIHAWTWAFLRQPLGVELDIRLAYMRSYSVAD